MRVTVIFDDNSIGVDGEFFHLPLVEPADPNHTAIQWYDDHGTIEVKQGDRIWLDSINQVQPYIDQWANQKAELDAQQVLIANLNSNPPAQGGPTIVAS